MVSIENAETNPEGGPMKPYDVLSGFWHKSIFRAVGSKVELSFSLPGSDKTLVCAGEVVNVPDTHQYGMGVRFLDLKPDDEATLIDFIRTGGGHQ